MAAHSAPAGMRVRVRARGPAHGPAAARGECAGGDASGEFVAVAKRSISFDPELLRQAEILLEERDSTLSGLVNEALTRELKLAGLRRLLDEDDERFGPVPPEVRAEVAADWPA